MFDRQQKRIRDKKRARQFQHLPNRDRPAFPAISLNPKSSRYPGAENIPTYDFFRAYSLSFLAWTATQKYVSHKQIKISPLFLCR